MVLAVAATVITACGAPPDAPVAPAFARFVRDARASLHGEWERPAPVSFRLAELRCRRDGGLLVVFDQQGPFGSEGWAIAMSGNPRPGGTWGGGFAPIELATDPEVAGFFSALPEVPCDAALRTPGL